MSYAITERDLSTNVGKRPGTLEFADNSSHCRLFCETHILIDDNKLLLWQLYYTRIDFVVYIGISFKNIYDFFNIQTHARSYNIAFGCPLVFGIHSSFVALMPMAGRSNNTQKTRFEESVRSISIYVSSKIYLTLKDGPLALAFFTCIMS